MTGDNHNDDELPDNQDHLHVNETPINDDVLTEGEYYTVTVDVSTIDNHSGGFDLTFRDGEGEPRDVAFLHWMTDIQRDRFETGMRVTITHVKYEYNDPYHNLQVTGQSDVITTDTPAVGTNQGASADAPKQDFDEEAAIADALAETRSDSPANDTGHAQTTYPSTECLKPLVVHEYLVQVEQGTDPSPRERRKLTYDVVQHIVSTTGIPATKRGELRVAAVNSIDIVNVAAIEGVAGL